jgi:hypothetical protein
VSNGTTKKAATRSIRKSKKQRKKTDQNAALEEDVSFRSFDDSFRLIPWVAVLANVGRAYQCLGQAFLVRDRGALLRDAE